jgi:hypothetical protein
MLVRNAELEIANGRLIELPFAVDLTRAGVGHLCRRLPFQSLSQQVPSFNDLRQSVAENVGRLALLRYLSEQGVPYSIEEVFSPSAGSAHLLIGGRRCSISTELIAQKQEIRTLAKRPERWFSRPIAEGKGPANQNHAEPDIRVFAALTALVTKGRTDLATAIAAGQPYHLVYPLPPKWSQSKPWKPLGALSFNVEKDDDIQLELGGLDGRRRFLQTTLYLKSGRQVVELPEFHSIAYLHSVVPPIGQMSVYNPATSQTLVVQPKDWGNLWLYGLQILVLGYVPGTNTPSTYGELRPLGNLVQRARAWGLKQDSIGY